MKTEPKLCAPYQEDEESRLTASQMVSAIIILFGVVCGLVAMAFWDHFQNHQLAPK